MGTRLQETVLWCTLQSPSVSVSLSQSPSIVMSTSMCLATSLSLAPWEEGPSLHNLGLRKGKEEPGYYPKTPLLARPMGDGSPQAKGEASMERRPWPLAQEHGALFSIPAASSLNLGVGTLQLASPPSSSLTPGDPSNSEVPSRLCKRQRQLLKGIWGSVRKRKCVLGRPPAVSALQTVLW